MKKLKKILRKEFGVKLKVIDKNQTLLQLAETVTCMAENCTVEEAYGMYIGGEQFHLPGWTAMIIADRLGLDLTKTNTNQTLVELIGD